MRLYVYRMILLSNLLLAVLFVKAQVYESATNVYFEGSSFHEDSIRVAREDKWGTVFFSLVQDRQVKDIVTLQVIENPSVVFPDSFRCTVHFNVVWWDQSGTLHNEGSKQLSVSYNSSAYAIDSLVSYLTFYGAYKDSITITDIDATGFPDTILPVFRLESSIEILRDYSNSLLCLIEACGAHQEYQPDKDELLVSWNDMLTDTLSAYDEIELEWTFYDDSSKVVKQYMAPYNVNPYTKANFYNNATRVITKDDHYSIPLLYERGYLLWRIRLVRVISYGDRMYGPWTTDSPCDSALTNYIYRVNGHQENLNWQSSLSFAEEGKRKGVISYFDGASKNRQSVTKLSTTDIAVVAETLYDNEGRDVVSTLPAPTISSIIKHFQKFNVNVGDTTYSWRDLDSMGSCIRTPRVMKTDSGASRYYSPTNPNRNIAENRYIPDADGYPFNQKQYTGDLTGRIRRTSGPGNTHKMGGGHETSYLYGVTSDAELKRLFGNNVGLSSHYFKNLQKDPNGQVSVTYLDMHGRTIATALAGKSIDVDMDSLPDFRADTIIRDAIIDSVSQYREGLSVINTKTFTVATGGIHKFCYSLLPESMQIKSCDSSLYCFDCVYDLNITITGDCNSANLPGGIPYVFIDSNYTIGEDLAYYFDTTCANNPPPIIDSFQVTLPFGEYTITKKISIKPQALDYYYNYYIRNDSCVKTFSDFYNEALSGIDAFGCSQNCDQCKAALGDSASFINNYIDKIVLNDSLATLTFIDTLRAAEAYAGLKKTCALLCDEYSLCQQKADLLLYDMSPNGGQYATDSLDEATGNYIVTEPTSIFSNNLSIYSLLYGKTVPLYADPSILYKDAYGRPDTLFFDTNGDNILEPYLPNELYPELFIQNWKDSWANALLPYHPEYCYWLFCDTNEASNSFDALMRATDNYDSAVARGFLNPAGMSPTITGYTNIGITDPFFQAGGQGNSSLSTFRNNLQYYAPYSGGSQHFSLWEVAQLSIKCSLDTLSCLNCKKDYYWNTFRNAYLGLKQRYVDTTMKQFAASRSYCHVPDFNSGPYQSKKPRFIISTEVIASIYEQLGINDPDNIDTLVVMGSAQDSIDNNGALFNCRDYVAGWKYSLQHCGFDSILLADSIIPRLVAVCEMGRDMEHPLGASSVPPDSVSVYGDHSFEEVISLYATPSDTCSSYLITNPMPYGNTAYYQTGVYSRPDSCVCGNIADYHNKYETSGFSGSFSAYLNQMEHIVVSEDDINVLWNSCNDPSCDILKHPVSLPYAFECDKVCVNCYQLVKTYNHFINEFPNILSSPNYLSLFAAYLNQNLNMNLTAVEYLDFMRDSCQFTFPEPPTANCTSPNAIDDYYEISGNDLDTLDVLSNDTNLSDGELSIIKQGTAGVVIMSFLGDLIGYTPFDTTQVADTIIYSICHYCEGKQYCDTATVYINAEEPMMMMGFSPDNDSYGLMSSDNSNTENTLLPNPFHWNTKPAHNNISPDSSLSFFIFKTDSVDSGETFKDVFNKNKTQKIEPPAPMMSEGGMMMMGGGMMLMESGGSPGIGWQATWCDSIAASIHNYDSIFVQNDSVSPYALVEILNNDLGVWHSLPEWVDMIVDSCALDCPSVINCSEAQTVLNNFYATYPEFQNAAPSQFLSNYLNAYYHTWLPPDSWQPSLKCCGISYPHDTLVSYCDQLQIAVSRYDSAVANNNPDRWDFRGTICSVMGWSRYDIYGNWIADNDLIYWIGQMDSCGISCNSIVNCSAYSAAMDSFYINYPQYITHCPSIVLRSYLGRLVPMDEGYEYEEWLAIAACCGISLPADTTPSLCDTAFMWHMLALNVEELLQLDTCLPAFAWERLLAAFTDTEDPVAMFDKMGSCGYALPDTCMPPVSFCDSIETAYFVFQKFQAVSPDDHPSLEGVVSVILGREMEEEGEIINALINCDSSYACPFFMQYDTFINPLECVKPYVWAHGLNLALVTNQPYEHWASLFTHCEHPLPNFCNDDNDNLCDSLLAIQEFEMVVRNTIGMNEEDTSEFRENLYSRVLGYSLTNSQIDSMLRECSCGELENLKDVMAVLYSDYTITHPCQPMWAIEIVLNVASNNEPNTLDYTQICAAYASCGIICPDTCHNEIGTTFCDSLFAARNLLDRLVQDFNVGEDSTDILEYFVLSLLHRPMTYAAIMSAIDSCNSLPATRCDSLQWVSDAYFGNCTNTSFHPAPLYYFCVPNVPIDTVSLQMLGTSYNLNQFLDLLWECDSTSITCKRIRTSMSIYNSKKAMAGIDTTVLVAIITDNILGYPITYDRLNMYYTGECRDDNCPMINAIINGAIDSLLAAEPELLFLPQSMFEEELYSYLDSTLNGGVSGVDWCGLLVNCGDSCPTVYGEGALLCNRPLLPPPAVEEDSCLAVQQEYAYHQAAQQYDSYIRNLHDNFMAKYAEKCLQTVENLEHERNNGEFHFTLYYYDQAGNLVQTVPPAGVNLSNPNAHTMTTRYLYNTANQVVKQYTPDADSTYTWYDKIGLPVFSQNAKQRAQDQVSYTKYDPLKRVTEVGQYDNFSTDYTTLDAIIFSLGIPSGTGNQVTKTFYDEDVLGIGNMRFLRNRVAAMTYEDVDDGLKSTYDIGTHFSYDNHGNVEWLKREIPYVGGSHIFKTIDYKYDLISGKVNEVVYERGNARESFFHQYAYDADNRLTDVYTSRDSTYWEHDAHYSYYLHGPLARVVMGDKQVQGVDYAYTIQGWIKGINSGLLTPNNDIGNDGNSIYDITARDEVSYTLGYFGNDYKAIGLGTGGSLTSTNISFADRTNLSVSSLFNGNIGSMETNIKKLNSPLAYRYRYDQLNRLTQMRAFDGLDSATNSWPNSTPITAYGTNYRYDPNGNILKLNRNGVPSLTPMDSFTYHYNSGTNQLNYVSDVVGSSNYATDIDNQSSGNYSYDEIGNLIKDNAGCIDSIRWTVYGKVWKIFKCNGDSISFKYYPSGERAMKEVWNDSMARMVRTYYLRDATGNELASHVLTNEDTVRLASHTMYGSSRLGIWQHDEILWVDSVAAGIDPEELPDTDPITEGTTIVPNGKKRYELANHLGNVLATVNDRKIPQYVSGAFNHYTAEVTTANDYYPFGMIQPKRSFEADWANSSLSYKEECNVVENLCDFTSAYAVGASILDAGRRWYPTSGTSNLDTLTYNGSRMLKVKTESIDSGYRVYLRDTLVPNANYTISWKQHRFGGATSVRVYVYGINPITNAVFSITSTTNNGEGTYGCSFTADSYPVHIFRFETVTMAEGSYILLDDVLLARKDSCEVYPSCDVVKQACVQTLLNCNFETAYKSGINVFDNDTKWYPITGKNNLDTLTYNGSRMLKLKAENIDSGHIVFFGDSLLPNKSYTITWDQYRFGGATDIRVYAYYYSTSSTLIGYVTNNANGQFSYSFTTNSYPKHIFRFEMPTALASGKYVLLDNVHITYVDSCETFNCDDSPSLSAEGDRKGYRFGFGSHEKDNEVHGEANWYTFGDYGYDPRVVQRPRTDPEAASTPSWSPYRAFKDNPIIYTDLFGNTEFYYKGKWQGSDGQNNGMIGIVKTEDVANMIKKGDYPDAKAIKNGANTDGLFVIHNSILKSSVDVLNQSLTKKGENREFGEKLKKTPDGNYESMGGIQEGPAVDLDKGERGNVTLPEGGDVSIHSHLTGITEGGNYTDAKKPSPEDKAGMNNEEMSIIVGLGGDPKKVTYTDEQGNNVTETHDIRKPEGTIEFFDKGKSSYSLNGYDANKISKDYQGKRK